jgi:hypothetical protein
MPRLGWGLALNHDPPDLHLPSRHASTHPPSLNLLLRNTKNNSSRPFSNWQRINAHLHGVQCGVQYIIYYAWISPSLQVLIISEGLYWMHLLWPAPSTALYISHVSSEQYYGVGTSLRPFIGSGMVVHTYNHSYSKGRDWRITIP